MKSRLDALKRECVASFDCTKAFPADQYFGHGDVQVVDAPCGRYRQAEGKPLSRFGYRFAVKRIDRPHLLTMRYPDDRRRFIIINDGTGYDMSTGIVSGGATPLSHEMQTIEMVFWPRATDCSIVFMTWGYDEPAAMASIDVHELADLPAMALGDVHQLPNRRAFGVQYEDPCGIGGDMGAMNFDTWLDRYVSYARYTGQKLLSYPICWYHGPLFPSTTQPSDCFHIVIGPDRKQYAPWTQSPPDWPAQLLERFGKEGLQFQGICTLLRLGNLMKNMNIDLPAIHAGAETYNNMLWNNQVQAGTMDWTRTYNTINYPKIVGNYETYARGEGEHAYGEKTRGDYHIGAMFNPLHPTVQSAVIEFFREIGQRYGKYSAFRGVTIQMWVPSLLWFGSLHAGYDDYTVGLFMKETGVPVPGDAKDPNRFAKRFEFLTFIARPTWIAWRCQKIREYILKVRDAIKEGRPDLKLTLNMYIETNAGLVGYLQPHQQLFCREGGAGIAREAGLDIDLFANDADIEFDLQFDGGARDRTFTNEVANCHPLSMHQFRDHDFLDDKTLSTFSRNRQSGVLIFNAWHEAWGDHQWFHCEPDDTQVEKMRTCYGRTDDKVNIFRLNSTYPKDGFWWDSQLRITHAFPPGEHFMEYYAHAVAELDACHITRGGLFLDRTNSPRIEKFAAAYRALPMVKFDTVGESTDPVAVRTIVQDGRRYFYLVNREYAPVDVTLTFSSMPTSLTNLADGTKVACSSTTLKLTLSSFELISFSCESGVSIVSFTATMPKATIDALLADTRRVLNDIDAVRKTSNVITGLDRFVDLITQARDRGQWSRLRHALTSYISRRCQELTGDTADEKNFGWIVGPTLQQKRASEKTTKA